MRFCDKCGSRMKTVKNGFTCSKCGNVVPAKTGLVQVANMNPTEPNQIYVIEDSRTSEVRTVSRVCPQCGNDQAFRWLSSTSGEHAGVRQERTVEHFRCIRCLHSWAETC